MGRRRSPILTPFWGLHLGIAKTLILGFQICIRFSISTSFDCTIICRSLPDISSSFIRTNNNYCILSFFISRYMEGNFSVEPSLPISYPVCLGWLLRRKSRINFPLYLLAAWIFWIEFACLDDTPSYKAMIGQPLSDSNIHNLADFYCIQSAWRDKRLLKSFKPITFEAIVANNAAMWVFKYIFKF